MTTKTVEWVETVSECPNCGSVGLAMDPGVADLVRGGVISRPVCFAVLPDGSGRCNTPRDPDEPTWTRTVRAEVEDGPECAECGGNLDSHEEVTGICGHCWSETPEGRLYAEEKGEIY